MVLTDNWFDLNKGKDDTEIVFEFVQTLPNNISQIFDESTSNFQKIYLSDSNNISIKLFYSAFNEAKDILLLDLEFLFVYRIRKRRFNRTGKRFRFLIEEELSEIGFTNDSLKLKATVLNNLWRSLRDKMKEIGDNIIDFSKNEITQLVSKFLTYLNSILGSLKELIPGIEGIKEFKEIIESFLGVGEKL